MLASLLLDGRRTPYTNHCFGDDFIFIPARSSKLVTKWNSVGSLWVVYGFDRDRQRRCKLQPHLLTPPHPPRALNRGVAEARFSKAPETFRARKAKAKPRTLRLPSCFVHIFLVWRQVHFIQEVSGVYTSPFLHSDERKIALRAENVSGAFEKRAPGESVISKTNSVWLGAQKLKMDRT